jgi:hypothetical protein
VTPEERRRGIELIMDERPGADLDELQRLLGEVGVEVDEATLVGDLDALGYEVDDVAPPAPVAGDGNGTVGWARSRRDGVVVLLVAVAVLIVITVVLFVGDDEGDPVATGITEAPLAQAGGASDSTGTTGEVPVAPEGPGSDPALDAPETLTDDFERGDIGDFPGVATWELVRGYWANTDGNLEPLGPPDEGAVVAAVDVGSGDVRAQVQIDRPASRAGLAFRIVDEGNLFVWAPVPEMGTIVLFEVVDGEAMPVSESGYAPPGDGMPALGINLVGDRAELLRDGVVIATYEGLPPADGATRIGVALLAGGEGLPLFDELRVLVPRPGGAT